jgi:glycosyltransferase involved in cell wall biosynthesis
MSSRVPAVSFVVPCYNLAHYLRDCIESILAQDYKDFEILIMDDCSPDDTAAVAATFTDPRVQYIRNPKNLRHLQNYNRGIQMSRGRYLWLISADDRLRTPTALGNLVALLDANPQMSFACAPGILLFSDGKEGKTIGDNGPNGRIYSSDEFLHESIVNNIVVTPGVLARTECYRRVGFFPLDLPQAGDWYLWNRFAQFGTVGYDAEPGVHYRQHAGSNTAMYRSSKVDVIVHDEVTVRWRTRGELAAAGRTRLLERCDYAIAQDFALRTFSHETKQHPEGLSVEAVRQWIAHEAGAAPAAASITRRYYELLADIYHDAGRPDRARHYYRLASLGAPFRASALAKYAFSCLGRAGLPLRHLAISAKRNAQVSQA